jgi:vacuolar-type H+-ATPase subunit D/Vma8
MTSQSNGSGLDPLIRQYLERLDQYQQLQAVLSSELSQGYMDIARANYSTSTSASGLRRFGQDQYDERVKAAKKIKINDENTVTLAMVESEKKVNPINMFGILVPSSLREAQQCFVVALDKIIEVINSKQDLLALEKKIKKLKEKVDEITTKEADINSSAQI